MITDFLHNTIYGNIYWNQWGNNLIQGGLANLEVTDYLFSAWARPENLFSGKPRPEFFFHSQQNLISKKKGGSECCLRRKAGQGFPCLILFVFE